MGVLWFLLDSYNLIISLSVEVDNSVFNAGVLNNMDKGEEFYIASFTIFDNGCITNFKL